MTHQMIDFNKRFGTIGRLALTIRRLTLTIALAVVCTALTSCSGDDDVTPTDTPTNSPAQPTEVGYQGVKNPVQTAISTKENEVTWSCIEFGAYPANEVVDGTFDAVDAYAVREGDVIRDATLYAKLTKATWTDDETVVDGRRYRRINGQGAVSATTDRDQHYRWADTKAWHYFEYAPMKWRVLMLEGSIALLLADRMPDVCPFNSEATDVCWEVCSLRRWLNGEFINRAFSASEQAAIVTTTISNAPNYYFGTSSGPSTSDRVFVLSELQVFVTETAKSYGFYPGDELNDKARRFTATMYAKCRGAWWSSKDALVGNSFWSTRTNGYTMANTTFVGDAGDIYNRGISVTCNDIAVLPALYVDLSQGPWRKADDVHSTDVNKEQGEGLHQAYYTGDAYGQLQSPYVSDPQTFGHTTRWSCLQFGAYPTSEVVSSTFQAVDDYALNDGEVIRDATLYEKLTKATWTADDTEIDGQRYHRIRGDGAVTASVNRDNHYRWADTRQYHYFAYKPIKWRVVKIRGTQATLLADRMPDSHPFHDRDEDTDWSRCSLRSWLNGEFLGRAFTTDEQAAIVETVNDNDRNSYYGTACGPSTTDKVFILSANEIYASPTATAYGFYAGSGIDDPAKRFRSTLYAKCRGAWWSSVDAYRGNSFWMMRTSGYTNANAAYICDFGYLYVRGTSVTCDDAAVLPAITVDLSRARWQPASVVSSTDIIRSKN